MLKVLDKYIEDGYSIIKYTIDGENAHSTVKVLISDLYPSDSEVLSPSITEQILFETQYQTAILEILSLGGM